MPAIPYTDDQLQEAVDAYYEHNGVKAEAARALDLKRTTYNDRLKAAEERLGIKIGKVADGRVAQRGFEVRKPPRKGMKKFYLITSAQNNTLPHMAWNNMLAYADWLSQLPDCDGVEVMVSTFTYNVNAYGEMSVKRGRNKAEEKKIWYAPEFEPYIVDENVLIAQSLVMAGRQNILPTRKFPLSNKADLHGRHSNIIPHTKMHLVSVPSMADEYTKLNISTGTMTQRNYIQKDAGIMAEQEHSYGFLIVEVDDQQRWYPRHVEIDETDAFYDTGPDPYTGLYIQAGQVKEAHAALAVNWGDTHASEMDLWVRETCFGPDGILNELEPRFQFHNDLFSMRSRGHHDMKDPYRMYEKHADEEESVEDELVVTAEVLKESDRKWCETVVVPSNHDLHLDRWTMEADWRQDPLNARLIIELVGEKLRAIDEGDKDFSLLEYSLRSMQEFDNVRFLSLDESFVIGKRDEFVGIECGLHGDLGPNGARGSDHSLLKLGRPINKGHNHQATRLGLVMSAGACAETFPYMKGPNSHSVAHILTYVNGARTHLIMFDRKWRA